jgi:phosphopantetheine--protein transferase-like protein
MSYSKGKDMTIKGIGIDIMEIKRFLALKKNRNGRFLTNNFSEAELDYCFSFRDPAVHLAGTFAAKEAVFKSLGNSGSLASVIEIRRDSKGKPSVWIKNRRQKSIFISISHTAQTAAAVAVKQ